MNTEIYLCSIQLDSLISDKLRDSQFTVDSHKMTSDQLSSEINTLRYLLYLANQDRLVRFKQTLRAQLIPRQPTRLSGCSSNESVRKSLSKDFEDLHCLALYENTGNESDINTVVNTSILPYSCENTEREFSPFSVSPLSSPRLMVNGEGGGEYVTTAVLSTEVTGIKQRCNKEEAKHGYLEQEEEEEEQQREDPSLDTDKNDRSVLNCSNYIMQLQGDDDDFPLIFSETHSRENSPTH